MASEIKTNAPASKVPDWVKPKLFLDVLRATVKGFCKIKSFKVDSGSAAGEKYATIMLRLTIGVELEDGKDKSVSYMLKLPHQTEQFKKLTAHNNIFEAERNMYNIFVPELEQIWRDAGTEVRFGARAYELKGARSDYMLLEDLVPRGFMNMNRLEGLDQAHVEASLQRLAMWHAASAVRVATKGPYPKQIMIGVYKEENRAMLDEINRPISQNFVMSCATYEGHEEYIDEVIALQPKVIEGMFKMSKLDPTEFNVLNHGDLWCNNIMFSHDAFGKIKETYLVDYQLPKYGTVAQDLYYFLLSSTKFEDKLTKFDHFIKFYHEQLAQNLKQLDYARAIPSLREIHMTLFKYSFLGYMTVTGIMTTVLLERSEDANLENFVSESKEMSDFQSLINTNPRYRKHIQVVLPWLLNRGALQSI